MNKKFLIIFALALSLLPTNIFAVSSNANPNAGSVAKQNTLSEERIVNLKNKAEKEIDRRLTSLKNLSTKINNIKKLSESDKTALSKQLLEQQTSLENLKVEIQSETDLESLRTDVKAVKDSYNIYAFFVPKAAILTNSDVLLSTIEKMQTISIKLKDQIKTDNITLSVSAQNAIADMDAKIADAQTQYQQIYSTVMPLSPDTYPGSKTVFQQARKTLQTGRQDLVTARQDAGILLKALAK